MTLLHCSHNSLGKTCFISVTCPFGKVCFVTSLLELRDHASTEGMLIIVKSLEEILSNNASLTLELGICVFMVKPHAGLHNEQFS